MTVDGTSLPGEAADRPTTVVLVVGTGTEVGKTWVSAQVLRAWRAAGHRVAARKPVQSFDPGGGATDAEVLGMASGEHADQVCPPERSYPVPLAPPMAAAALGRSAPRLAELAGDLRWPAGPVAAGLVETVGGVRSPQADDADAVDVQQMLRPDRVLLVADAGLGAVNAVRLTADALGTGTAAPPLVVVLNRFDPADDCHRRNRQWLTERDAMTVVPVVPGALQGLADDLLARPAPAAPPSP